MSSKEEALEAFERASNGDFLITISIGKWSRSGTSVEIKQGKTLIKFEGARPIECIARAYRAWKSASSD